MCSLLYRQDATGLHLKRALRSFPKSWDFGVGVFPITCASRRHRGAYVSVRDARVGGRAGLVDGLVTQCTLATH